MTQAQVHVLAHLGFAPETIEALARQERRSMARSGHVRNDGRAYKRARLNAVRDVEARRELGEALS